MQKNLKQRKGKGALTRSLQRGRGKTELNRQRPYQGGRKKRKQEVEEEDKQESAGGGAARSSRRRMPHQEVKHEKMRKGEREIIGGNGVIEWGDRFQKVPAGELWKGGIWTKGRTTRAVKDTVSGGKSTIGSRGQKKKLRELKREEENARDPPVEGKKKKKGGKENFSRKKISANPWGKHKRRNQKTNKKQKKKKKTQTTRLNLQGASWKKERKERSQEEPRDGSQGKTH